MSGLNLDELCKQINSELGSLSQWFKNNKLSLNINKTSYMIFTNKTVKKNLNITLDNIILKRESHNKFLGIYLDEQLKWDVHIGHVKRKMSSGLYALNSLKHCLPMHQLKNIYYATVHSHLQYGCILWGNSHRKYLHQLEVAQKKAVRAIFHSKYNAPSNPLFKKGGILKLEDIYDVQLCSLMHRLVHYEAPLPLQDLRCLNEDIHQYNTRRKTEFNIRIYKNNTVMQSFVCQGPKKYLHIPDNIKGCNCKLFPKKLKWHRIMLY